MEMAKKTLRLTFWFTLAFAAVYIARNLIGIFQTASSFPWWAVFVFALLHFGPALVVEGILYGVLALIEKYKRK